MSAALEAEFIATRKDYRWPVGIFGSPGEIMSIEIPDSPTPLQQADTEDPWHSFGL